MENTNYVALTRQSGLVKEMRMVANNLANMSTTGYRHEGLIFSEYVRRLEGSPSVSMTKSDSRNTSWEPGAMEQSGQPLDIAIQGEGFFLVETPAGERLTRSGSFTLNAEGTLVTPDGYPVLDAGFTPIQVPADAGPIRIASDGTMSANAGPLAQIGLFRPANPLDIQREDGVMFATSEVEPDLESSVLQGYVENSNVNPILEITRMIEVQRAYEMGQNFLQNEDERVREAIRTVMK